MNAANASYLNPAITDTTNNGINEFIFVLKRANYILPTRALGPIRSTQGRPWRSTGHDHPLPFKEQRMNTFANTRRSLFASHAQSASPSQTGVLDGVRAYFASDSRRAIQSVLGLIWLLDGALQFQSFMYSSGFTQMLTGMEPGQPHWLSSSVGWGARLAGGNLDLWDTLFALTQVAIGLGLLFRPTVKLALAGSFVWVLSSGGSAKRSGCSS